MNNQDRIKQIKNIARNDKEAIIMLLSVCADIGSEYGVLLSVAKFDDAAEIILEYLTDRRLTNAIHSNGEKRCFNCGSTNLEYDGTCRDC